MFRMRRELFGCLRSILVGDFRGVNQGISGFPSFGACMDLGFLGAFHMRHFRVGCFLKLKFDVIK